ncbi:MAG: hypothetical protein EOP14_01210 [Pseudomonas sp.]|nr:MAG: hypothetical protein EOP14_01210 [Pseudomonas sp.]
MTTLLLAQQANVESEQKEIVVVGQRLLHWKGEYAIRGSKLRCSTKNSSGDRDIDALGCAAFDACADQLAFRIAETDEKNLSKEVRLSMKESVKRDLSICVAETRVVLISDLARQRQGVHGSNPS